ncbi:hypothetical protein C5S53_10235 [Methanophagales archaeon]|jgi:hypothetical protein|nr:hypothetical protein C5S53_10235 [Methanophagales archaeon]
MFLTLNEYQIFIYEVKVRRGRMDRRKTKLYVVIAGIFAGYLPRYYAHQNQVADTSELHNILPNTEAFNSLDLTIIRKGELEEAEK